jgi:hypothetical protein
LDDRLPPVFADINGAAWASAFAGRALISLVVKPESDFHRNLSVVHGTIFNVAANRHYLKPIDIAHRPGGPCYAVLDGRILALR